MVEVLHYSKVYTEDMDLGEGYREVRLQDGRVVLLQQINLGVLVPYTTVILTASAGATSLTSVGAYPAGRRIVGVTAKVLESFGVSNGLETLGIGDATQPTRWGSTLTPGAGSETTQDDFESGDMPIYATATDLLVVALGGAFDANGRLEVQIHSFTVRHH